MSAVPISLNVTHEHGTSALSIASGVPLFEGAVAWAAQNNVSLTALPQLVRELEAVSGPYLAVAMADVTFDNTRMVTWQYLGETSEEAALRSALAYNISRNSRLDRFLRVTVHRLRAFLGFKDQLPRVDGARLALVPLQLPLSDASAPAGSSLTFDIEVMPGETAVEAVEGFLRRTNLAQDVSAEVQQVRVCTANLHVSPP